MRELELAGSQKKNENHPTLVITIWCFTILCVPQSFHLLFLFLNYKDEHYSIDPLLSRCYYIVFIIIMNLQ